MQDNRVGTFIRRYLLAVICLVAPAVFALFALDRTVAWLVPSTVIAVPMTFEFASDAAGPKAQPATAAATPANAAPAPAAAGATKGAAPAEKTERPDPNIYLQARDISGRFHYAVASAFLYLAAAAALAFAAATVLTRLGAQALLASIAGFGILAFLIAQNPQSFELVRPLTVDAILNASDSQPLLKNLVFEGRKTGDIVASLVHFNVFVVLVPVGVLLTALYSVSVRPIESELTVEDLKTRRHVIRCVLALASGILVLSVIASEILVSWPPGMLTKAQALALRPVGLASTILLGAMGTIGLFAAIAPAIVAYALDVQLYRSSGAVEAAAVPSPKPVEAEKKTPARAAEPPRGRDELGFTTLSNVAGVLQILAPLFVAPMVELVKLLFAIARI